MLLVVWKFGGVLPTRCSHLCLSIHSSLSFQSSCYSPTLFIHTFFHHIVLHLHLSIVFDVVPPKHGFFIPFHSSRPYFWGLFLTYVYWHTPPYLLLLLNFAIFFTIVQESSYFSLLEESRVRGRSHKSAKSGCIVWRTEWCMTWNSNPVSVDSGICFWNLFAVVLTYVSMIRVNQGCWWSSPFLAAAVMVSRQVISCLPSLCLVFSSILSPLI